MTFRFAYPIILAVLPLVAGWLVLNLRRRPPCVNYSMTAEIVRFAGKWDQRLARVPIALRTACIILLILAAARPQLLDMYTDIWTSGVDIVLALDTSGSMRIQDFKLDGISVTRLTVIKKVVGDFIKKRETDRIGLVVFGTDAVTKSPLTMDKGLLLDLINRMTIGMVGFETAIGSAIAVGGKRLKDLKAKSKILILLTDGEHAAKGITPVEAAEAVSALGIRIYTIGIGIPKPTSYKRNARFSNPAEKQWEGFDESALKTIAQIGGGKYFHAADTKQLLEVYHIIDQAEKTEAKNPDFFQPRELYAYFLVPAMFFLVLEILLKSTVLRVIP